LTVNVAALLATPPTVTTTLFAPARRPGGTVTVIEFPLLLQFVTVAVVRLKATVLVPCEEPKPLPVMVTGIPEVPELGDRLVMLGAANNEVVAKITTRMAPPRERLRRIHVLRHLLNKQLDCGFYSAPQLSRCSSTLGKEELEVTFFKGGSPPRSIYLMGKESTPEFL
jgi:hypothetical protein